MKKQELIDYCNSLGIETDKKTKKALLEEVEIYRKNEINEAIEKGKDHELLFSKIEELANSYAQNLSVKIDARKEEMKADDNAHYLIYNVLGIADEEGQVIDEYQNTGRFLYKDAGSFLEDAASLCLKFNNVDGGKKMIENNLSQSSKTFEIDFLNGIDAIEIKWKDATTDGNHKTKEETRARAIANEGYTPIRVMFYYPQRKQAKEIQENLAIFYKGLEGQYYAGEDAWDFIKSYTGYDLKEILTKIAAKRIAENG